MVARRRCVQFFDGSIARFRGFCSESGKFVTSVTDGQLPWVGQAGGRSVRRLARRPGRGEVETPGQKSTVSEWGLGENLKGRGKGLGAKEQLKICALRPKAESYMLKIFE